MLTFKRQKELVPTSAHRDGKPAYDILYNGTKVGVIAPYSSYYDRKPAGSRIVTSRKNVTRYEVRFISIRSSMGYRNATDARKAAMSIAENHKVTLDAVAAGIKS